MTDENREGLKRTFVIVFAIAFLGMGAYAPYSLVDGEFRMDIGYWFLWDPPVPKKNFAEVNEKRLIIQFAVGLAIAGALHSLLFLILFPEQPVDPQWKPSKRNGSTNQEGRKW